MGHKWVKLSVKNCLSLGCGRPNSEINLKLQINLKRGRKQEKKHTQLSKNYTNALHESWGGGHKASSGCLWFQNGVLLCKKRKNKPKKWTKDIIKIVNCNNLES